jgi:hypothetical protein
MNPQVSDPTRQQKRDHERAESDLDRRYASIGLRAVAAASHYPSKPERAASPAVRTWRSPDDAA